MSPSPNRPRLSPPRPFARWTRLLPRRTPAVVVFIGADRTWVARAGEAAPSACEGFEAFCATQAAGTSVRVLVSSAFTHSVLLDAGVVARGAIGKAGHAARERLELYHGERARQWPLAVWAEGRAGAAALHGVDLTGLRSTTLAHGVQLRSVSPWWAVALPATERLHPSAPVVTSRGALALVENERLTWVAVDHGRLADLRQRRMSEPHVEALESLIDELRTGAGLDRRDVLVAGYGVAFGTRAALEGCMVSGLLDRPHPGIEWLFE